MADDSAGPSTAAVIHVDISNSIPGELTMPLIKVQTSLPTPAKAEVETLLKELSSSLASHLGKPESYVMTAFAGDTPMTFAGTTDPVCYIEIKSIGTMGSKTKTMSQDFCAKVEATLGVPKDRTYIEFADAQGAMWGWNGRTFG
jgi:phenylpyruvate tautomerase